MLASFAVGEIEVPKLAALVAMVTSGDNGVGILLIGRNLQSSHGTGGRTDGRELHLARGQVKASDSEDAAVNDGIGRIEQRDVLAGVAKRVELSAEPDVFHAGKIGLGKIDAGDFLKIVGIQNDNGIAELIEELAVRRDLETAAPTASSVGFGCGDVDRFDDFSAGQGQSPCT